ncbi:hypothetical protein V4F39_03640 [Aquincola sp. MAHUQ-54]|uniref:Nucleotide modification associated domain-containing protein n=1 Tax=Aquincola agrisoli TaxID=3119538 RepID=A0AAW9Q218_9BURK
MATALHSYVVRYDSGFAPNPFFDYCTLATCKPKIRAAAKVGDWILGSGSTSADPGQAGRLVYAMRVEEVLSWDQYSADPRFIRKRPFRRGSRKLTCGDNIYFRKSPTAPWQQRDSFHSYSDGSIDAKHLGIDTGVDRVLVSQQYLYLGGEGPAIPDIRDARGRPLCKIGIGHSKFQDPQLIDSFVAWLHSLRMTGFKGVPYEWLSLRPKESYGD